MDDTKFGGFELPKSNYSKLPHQLIDALPLIETASEMKVILYVLRHTWGFQEFDDFKRITLDEFQNGRKKKDGSRIDAGTGLSANAIKDGIKRAITHGFLIQVSDGRDFGRSSHVYQLRVSNSDTVSNFDTQPSKVDTQPSNFDTRSEKDTLERNPKEEESNFEPSSLDSSEPVSSETEDWDEPGSELLEITVEKLSRTFGDIHHLASNTQQAYNIWDKTSLGEEDFVAAIEQAAAATKEAISKSQVRQRDKRMAYFFKVLRQQLKSPS